MSASRWLPVLLTVGAILTAGDVILVALLVSSPPAWLWSMLSLAPWGPIALLTWALLARYQRMTRRLREIGIRTRGTVVSIGQTASQLNGRPVLRLRLAVSHPGRAAYQTAVRVAPPLHLVGMLRPGVSLPVRVDPDNHTRILIDWSAAEIETSPSG